MPETTTPIIVVAGALIYDGALLIAQRDRPPELAGLWELPGGKVGPGESEKSALARELQEELGVEVTVDGRIGADVALSDTMTLKAYLVRRTGGPVEARDHRALRWVTADDLADVDWVPADRAWLIALSIALRAAQV
jgi:8-oxo-dGTP diphosphatase